MKPIKRILNSVLPRRAAYALIYGRYKLTQALNKSKFLGGSYHCPICDSKLRSFVTADDTAWCPVCESGERHRVDWVFMRDRTNLLAERPKSMLHIAPEMVLVFPFRKIPNLRYLSADLEDPRAMQQVDITDMQYPDNSFDIIYCSHVLEHIVDDRKAMRELYRVCKPGGWGLLQVPITADNTFEDPAVATPEDRLRVFGHEGHVRRCGLDYADRLREAGFDVTAVEASEFITPDEFTTMGITKKNRYVFLCTKSS